MLKNLVQRNSWFTAQYTIFWPVALSTLHICYCVGGVNCEPGRAGPHVVWIHPGSKMDLGCNTRY
jgi:hypothetical protein